MVEEPTQSLAPSPAVLARPDWSDCRLPGNVDL